MQWESETEEQVMAREANWHEWFAWKPVYQKSDDKYRWVWWEKIYRRRKHIRDIGNSKVQWEYCFDDFELIKRTAAEQERLQQISSVPPANPAVGSIWINTGHSGHSGIAYPMVYGAGGGSGGAWTIMSSSAPVNNIGIGGATQPLTTARSRKKKPITK